jgi:hypothetical protein
MKHVVMYSGGVGSWAAARRVVEQHGTEDVVLLFADTLMEDADLYRFLDEGAAFLGLTVERIADGRDPWQIFFDTRFLGNTRADPCSRILKRDLMRKHIEEHYDPAETVLYLGIDWTESHRLEGVQRRLDAWTVRAPMCEAPYRDKSMMLDDLTAAGIERPRLYRLGFPHNNCGGFCIKAGQAHFKLLLETMPDRFAYHEAKEQDIRVELDKDIAILRDRRGGTTKPMTLAELRRRVESDQSDSLDLFEWGGCGCFAA